MTLAGYGPRVLLVLLVTVLAARAAGSLAARLHQPRVQGEIVAGILLGPSALGLLFPEGFALLFPSEVLGSVKAIARLGLVLFMFRVGLEMDFTKLQRHYRRVVAISHASIAVPMVSGVALGMWMHPRLGEGVDRLGFSLFLGVAMAITAFPVLARILEETGLAGTRLGVLVIACAAVDDVTAWCVLAVVVSIVESTDLLDVLATVLLSAAFVAVMVGVVKPLLARSARAPGAWTALAFVLLSSSITEAIGIHAIFGAFLAGAVMPRPSGGGGYAFDRVVSLVLLPVFFVSVGLTTRIGSLGSTYLWLVTALVVATAIFGKLAGSVVAGRLTGESWGDAWVIGLLMNTRGLTELVILTVGLELGVIGETVFAMMVVMALVTTMMAVPAVSLVTRLRTRRGASPAVVDLRSRPPEAEHVPEMRG
ncbi:MAG TPA: cation:proton antiporter [Acidimicrobiales bacterium]|nr:cation:proton antiporter [Acidimicrobiales bacterium]